MNRIDKKFRNYKIGPPSYTFFKGYDMNGTRETEITRGKSRLSDFDFIVPWQMNEKKPDKNKMS